APSGDTLRLSPRSELKGGPTSMLHAGLDLSRKKVDVCLLSETGEHLDQLAAPPDADSLRRLARRIEQVHHQPVCAVIESMTGARMVHDTLEAEGWAVEIADAQKVKGLAPLACKTDKIDSQVLATLSQRDLVPAIWLPDPRVREERELARFRLHLVKHRSMLKHRVHSSLVNFGRPCPVSDLFGVEGRKLLERLEVPEPWRGNITASVLLIDDLEGQIAEANRRLKQGHADHPYVPLLMSAPGIGWVLAFTIAAEIGEIERFSSPEKLTGYTGLCPRVVQSGDSDRRGPLSKHGPRYLRWALLEGTMHALKHPAYSERYQRNRKRLGKQRGAKVAQIDIARRLAHAIWHMLSRNQPFAPRGAAFRLAA
ncbi:MAG: IS110 family transposase, partial [Solirubrobacterales bacterium]